jgi:hypothetical protein
MQNMNKDGRQSAIFNLIDPIFDMKVPRVGAYTYQIEGLVQEGAK